MVHELLLQKMCHLYTIVGEVPANPIRKRFDEDVISKLLIIQWWNWSEDKVKENIDSIQSGRIEDLK